jgi:spore germination protein KB
MKEKVSRLQYFFMIPSILFGKAIGITAGVIVRKIGGDVWLTTLIGFVIGTVFTMLMVYIGSKFPENDIIEYSEIVFGKLLGKVIALLLAIYFAIAYAVSANVIILHLKEYFLPETPYIVLSAVYTLLCTYGVICGAEVVIRFSFFGFFMLWGINLTMISGTIADFDIINLQPILDKGLPANIANSIYTFSDTAMVILAIGMVYPMIHKKEKIGAITLGAMVVSIISVVVWPFFEVGVLGTDVMKQFVVVCMQQVRSAQLTRYLPRYELIMVTFFVWSVVVQSVVMFWSSNLSIKKLSGLKSDRMIVLVMTPVLIWLTNYLGKDHNDYINFLSFPWSQISAALSVGFPIIFLLTLFTKSRFKRRDKRLRSK